MAIMQINYVLKKLTALSIEPVTSRPSNTAGASAHPFFSESQAKRFWTVETNAQGEFYLNPLEDINPIQVLRELYMPLNKNERKALAKAVHALKPGEVSAEIFYIPSASCTKRGNGRELLLFLINALRLVTFEEVRSVTNAMPRTRQRMLQLAPDVILNSDAGMEAYLMSGINPRSMPERPRAAVKKDGDERGTGTLRNRVLSHHFRSAASAPSEKRPLDTSGDSETRTPFRQPDFDMEIFGSPESAVPTSAAPVVEQPAAAPPEAAATTLGSVKIEGVAQQEKSATVPPAPEAVTLGGSAPKKAPKRHRLSTLLSCCSSAQKSDSE